MDNVKSSLILPRKNLYNYFRMYKKGNMKAREIIILDGIKLVLSIVEEDFTNPNFEKEELLSVGVIGLIKSVDSFKIAKEYSFESYATKCIKNEIYRYMKQEKRNFYKSSLDQLLEAKEILDPIQDVISKYETEEEILIVRKMLYENIDNDLERQIIMLYFGFNSEILTEVKIAEELKISVNYVKQVIENFIRKMTIRMKEEYKVKKLSK